MLTLNKFFFFLSVKTYLYGETLLYSVGQVLFYKFPSLRDIRGRAMRGCMLYRSNLQHLQEQERKNREKLVIETKEGKREREKREIQK